MTNPRRLPYLVLPAVVTTLMSCAPHAVECVCADAHLVDDASREAPVIVWEPPETTCRIEQLNDARPAVTTVTTSPFLVADTASDGTTFATFSISDPQQPDCRGTIEYNSAQAGPEVQGGGVQSRWIRHDLDLLDVSFSGDGSLLGGLVAGQSNYQVVQVEDGADTMMLPLLDTLAPPVWIGNDVTLAVALSGGVQLWRPPADQPLSVRPAPLDTSTAAFAWSPVTTDIIAIANASELLLFNTVSPNNPMLSASLAAVAGTTETLAWVPGWILLTTSSGYIYTFDENSLAIDERIGPFDPLLQVHTCQTPARLWVDTGTRLTEIHIPDWRIVREIPRASLSPCSGALAVIDGADGNLVTVTFESGTTTTAGPFEDIGPIANLYWDVRGRSLYVRGNSGSALLEVTR